MTFRSARGDTTSDLSSLEAANQGPVLLCPRGLLNVICRLSTVRPWSKVDAKSNYTRQWASDVHMKWERKRDASCDFSCWCIERGCLRLANSVTGQRRGRWRHWEPVMSLYWQFYSFKIFVISVYSSATAVGVCLSRIYLGHGICFGNLKYDIIFWLWNFFPMYHL
jgi:hypothetical protein